MGRMTRGELDQECHALTLVATEKKVVEDGQDTLKHNLPFVTGWMGENHFSETPMALYGVVLLMAAIAFTILQKSVLSEHGTDSLLSNALEKDVKEKLSTILYVLAIPLAFVNQWISAAIFIIVALIWIVPEKRIENALKKVRVHNFG